MRCRSAIVAANRSAAQSASWRALDASQSGVSLRDRSHELEAIGELPDALGAEEPVDLRPGPEVRLDGPLREPRLGCFRLALGGLALRPRLLELAFDQRERVLRVVVLLGHRFELVLETRELVLGRLHLPGGGRRERSQGERRRDHGEDEHHGYREPCDLPPCPGHELLGPSSTKAPSPEPSPEATHASVGRQTPALPRGGTREADRSRSASLLSVSGRRDLNPRPQRPERCALPSCATSRARQSSV